MNRFNSIAILVATLSLLASCVKVNQSAKVSDLEVLGISDRKLMLNGTEGVTTSFSLKANYDWRIIDYKGFVCVPSSGTKTEGNEIVTITAIPQQTNNSADTIRLSDLNFKLLSTRFVGISAYQLPQIMLPDGNRAYVDAVEDSKTSIRFMSKCESVDVTSTGDIEILSISDKNKNDEYTITIKATNSNGTPSTQKIGSIGFVVDGITQGVVIDVIQASAISLDRNIVFLSGHAGATNMLEISSDFEINVSSKSSLFVLSEVRKKSYCITATSDNANSENRLLGEVVVSLNDMPDCKQVIEVWQRSNTPAPQTIMVYFVGTQLSRFFETNISKMLSALNGNIQQKSRVVVIFSNSTTDATLYELRYDEMLGKAVKEKVKELSLPTPYNASLFERNIRELKELAPAEKYALVIGSHGHGWTPKNFTATSSSHLMKMGFGDLSLLWQKPEGALTRHIGDNGYTVQYDICEIAEGIVANNIKLEYLLFDSCYMGNIESAYELRNATKYIIGSPCEIMGAGFPYAKVMPYMLAGGGTSYNLDKICSEYVEHYRNDKSVGINSACIALTNTAELEALATTVKAVNSASTKSDFSLYNVQTYDGISSAHNPVHIFYDLKDLVEQSCADKEVVKAFNAQIAKTVTSLYHTDRFYSAYDGKYHDVNYYSGITTSAMVDFCRAEWQQTAWYKATRE